MIPPTQRQPHPAQPAGPYRVRLVEHPGPCAPRGMPVWCTDQGRNVGVRCGHTWHEPEMTRAGYHAVSIPGGPSTCPAVEAALGALGFDGTFRGVVTVGPRLPPWCRPRRR
ncbi:hypothetical protein F3K43_38450 [Streptomyces sp. LBUM 1476]|nr:hypothetical protein [Streptomyces sp. LBUM 1476]GAQ56069.1 hypothetical protein a10_05919 [Streptomyces acidiscabies]GAV43004.1 hypothetical protein Saa2_05951 [Streptomyces acidiscabies]